MPCIPYQSALASEPVFVQRALALGVPSRRINEVVLGRRSVTAETDLLLTRYFGLSEGLFLRLQTSYDLEEARRKLGDKLQAVRPRAA